MRALPLVMTGLILSITFLSNAQAVTLSVSGDANPYLAGMPNGSIADVTDVAPDQSPIQVEGLVFNPGTALMFQASGSVQFDPNIASSMTPDGYLDHYQAHGAGAENGMSNYNMPLTGLLGVFLADDLPNTSPSPTLLDFSSSGNVAGGTSYLTISPQLKQIFFIGDGLTGTGSGTQQTILVPTGATRLFLGVCDGAGWFNNTGSYSVTVNPIPEPSTLIMLLGGFLSLISLRHWRKR